MSIINSNTIALRDLLWRMRIQLSLNRPDLLGSPASHSLESVNDYEMPRHNVSQGTIT